MLGQSWSVASLIVVVVIGVDHTASGCRQGTGYSRLRSPQGDGSCGTRSTAATRSMWRTAGGPLAVQESVDSRPRCGEAFVQNHSSSSLIWVSLSSPAKTARGAGHRDRTRQRPATLVHM